VGIDPTRLFFYQFEAVCLLSGLPRAAILPLMDEDLPSIALYDTVFSMGVLYHRRNPLDHLACLKRVMRPGAELVLETLIVEDESRYPHGLIPTNRYAKMRNVWSVPTIKQVIGWLQQAGFQHARVADVSPTTTKEQRQTPWMTFESLSDFLDPLDESKTVEGYPAPVRAIAIAER
jgi:tRNA (mo5U34)-methyltransferase